ncbi:DMP19 family protein [Chitinophaga nivalis]|uniref:DMP19 family protein n=1 Tax=Chitinophaga nivalis TaxID=2991709 RepID=A0ABT3IJI3_9BACT|nr:DMP19 family protein [Chitinophaga nivalis]MCW3466169.1 DMP19 family protein [Chitinophaga nivalis]MCW3484140.1 DMP19 family protein [Chitinophaga nivalis]
MEFLPTVKKEIIAAAREEDWDFIYAVLEPYQDAVEEAEDEFALLDQLSDDQQVLLTYDALYGQVTNGGFLQLIHNGYGQFVFENSFIDDLQRWSLQETAALLRQAEAIYVAHKELLEEERELEAFSRLYKEFTHFEPLDSAFYDIMDEEVTRFRKYLETNLASFIKVV